MHEKSDARVGVVSFRGVNNGPWNVHAFGLVDLVLDVFGGTELLVGPTTNRASSTLTTVGKRLDLVRKLPGRVTVSPTVSEAGPFDVVFAIAHDMTDLDRLYLSEADWYSDSAVKILVMVEAWPIDAEQYPLSFARVLSSFDHVYTCLESGAAALEAVSGRPVRVLAQSVDVLGSPWSDRARCDILSFGRRSEPQHELFGRWAGANGWYRYDTLPLSDNIDIVTHRRTMAESIAYAALTVSNYARFDDTRRIGDLRVVGTRFWEIVASGGVPIGDAPTEEMWGREFGDLPGFVQLDLSCDSSDVGRVSDAVAIGSDPEIRRANRAFALERCDFAYRVDEIFGDAGISAPAALRDRLQALAEASERVRSGEAHPVA
ncbi:MAG: hypothetical protein R2689_07815 [Microthrixaceae bacterium]